MGSEGYSEKAAARLVAVHPRTLRRWRVKGRIGFIRTASGRIKYRIEDLMEATSEEYVPAIARERTPVDAHADSPADDTKGKVDP